MVFSGSETQKKQDLLFLGSGTQDIITSYYSSDSQKKAIIKKWLSDASNQKTSFTGDVLEFFDYCETLRQQKDLKIYITQELSKGKNTTLSPENKDIFQSLLLVINGTKTPDTFKSDLQKMIPTDTTNQDEKDEYKNVMLYLAFYNNIVDSLENVGKVDCKKIYGKIYK
jgi:hypothetical protein